MPSVRKRPIQAAIACRWSSYQFLRIEGVAWSAQRIPTAFNLGFLAPEPLLFHSSSSSVILTRLSGPPFKTHYFTENLIAPAIEQVTSGSVARNSDDWTIEAVTLLNCIREELASNIRRDNPISTEVFHAPFESFLAYTHIVQRSSSSRSFQLIIHEWFYHCWHHIVSDSDSVVMKTTKGGVVLFTVLYLRRSPKPETNILV
jgi:hypothetical protein